MKKLSYYISLIVVGAVGYNLLEVIWRGYTHWSMSVDGGLCLLFIGIINDRLNGTGKFAKSIICSIFITFVEFISGVIFNLWLNLNVWDYSDYFMNILGQICPLYSLIWVGLSYIILSVLEIIETKRKKAA